MRTDALLLPSVLKSFDAAADAAGQLTAAAAGASRSTVTAAVAGESTPCPLWSDAQTKDNVRTSRAGRDQIFRDRRKQARRAALDSKDGRLDERRRCDARMIEGLCIRRQLSLALFQITISLCPFRNRPRSLLRLTSQTANETTSMV